VCTTTQGQKEYEILSCPVSSVRTWTIHIAHNKPVIEVFRWATNNYSIDLEIAWPGTLFLALLSPPLELSPYLTWEEYYVSQYKMCSIIQSLIHLNFLKIEAIRSSETSVHTRTTQRQIPEDGILHSHRRENLKSYIIRIVHTRFLFWFWYHTRN
jgi:hypothetical protein